jgi:hypothetical protein
MPHASCLMPHASWACLYEGKMFDYFIRFHFFIKLLL